MKRIKYPVCSECGEEINPIKYDDCEKYYQMDDGEILCRGCFLEKNMEYLERNTDDFAILIGALVIRQY